MCLPFSEFGDWDAVPTVFVEEKIMLRKANIRRICIVRLTQVQANVWTSYYKINQDIPITCVADAIRISAAFSKIFRLTDIPQLLYMREIWG